MAYVSNANNSIDQLNFAAVYSIRQRLQPIEITMNAANSRSFHNNELIGVVSDWIRSELAANQPQVAATIVLGGR